MASKYNEDIIDEVESIDDVESTDCPDSITKKRFMPSRESVTAEFDSLLEDFSAEIVRLHENPEKPVMLRWLRGMRKKLEIAHKHNTRVCKMKVKNPNRKHNKNGGFLKPQIPSIELSEFLGLNPDEEICRTVVHSEICKYVKENGLKTEKGGFIQPDDKLIKLFGVSENYRYCDIHKFLTAHLSKKETV